MKSYWVALVAVLSSACASAAGPYDTRELERLNKALYERTFEIRPAFLDAHSPTSPEAMFYWELLDQINIVHYSAEEVVSLGILLTGYHVPTDNLFMSNGAFRMRQICSIANEKMTDMAENNRVPGTKVGVAQAAGAAQSVCKELERLWSAYGPPKSKP